jgi:5'-nucleotidase
MRIFVDMDGVLTDFESGFLKKWQQKYPEKFFKPLKSRITPKIADDYPSEFKTLIFDIYYSANFIKSLPPIPGCVDALNEMRDMGIEVFICTSPFIEYKNCVLEKYQWIDQHLGIEWIKNLILIRDKTLINADILIDDMPKISGIEQNPIWEHVLFDQPYNKNINKRRIINWRKWKDILSK